jgi:hypothetical protein
MPTWSGPSRRRYVEVLQPHQMHVRRAILALLVGSVVAAAVNAMPFQSADGLRLWRGTLLHAHNCYPEDGRWADRIERAIATGSRPLVIEQDLVWDAGRAQPVLSHGAPLSGSEPTLETYFFQRVRPIVERALAEGRRDTWPIIVLHLDFKTNEPEHHRAIWDLLGKYETWLTWAPRLQSDTPQSLRSGPLLVLTEAGAGQEDAFYVRVPVGGKLRIFGAVPPEPSPSTGDREADLRAAASRSLMMLIPSAATNYRRWTNHAWAVVEEGGQAHAGPWSAGDGVRLNSLVSRAHSLGLWIRFYTLNGHAPGTGLGWTASYNFGSLEAVRARWDAAIHAGVDFVATDQYEEFAARLVKSPAI